MIRGTTPTLEFELPFDTDLLSDGWVSFSQGDRLVLDKQLSSCKCEENKVSVRLSQEDTLKLEANRMTQIQLRVRTDAGEALASQIITVDTDRILKDGVI